ncbi:MAG: VPS10 domain-containing protein, partial [Flavobacteriales bacterium]
METYNLGNEGGFPVSWQSNAYCMDACKNDPNVVVAGIEGGDLFKSTDKGLTWLAVTEGLPVSTPTAVRIAPSDCSTIYFVANGSLYRTTNGGTSWADVNSVSGSIYEIEVHPTNPNTVLICGGDGVWKSTDGGNNFTPIYSESCWDVKFHPTNSSIVYLLKTNDSANKCEFYKSVDGGDSFTIQTNGWYNPEVVNEAEDIGAKIGLSAAAPDQVYVALLGASKANDNGWISVYKSVNAGANWTNPSGQDGGPYDATNQPNLASINPDGTGFHQGFYNFAVGVSQSDASRLWVGCLSLNLSTDGGANFERIGGYSVGPNNIGWIHPDVQDIVTVGNDVWVTTDGGINYSSDDLATHESRKYGIYNSTFWGYNQGWNQDIMVGGRYHNGNTGYFENYPEGDHLRLGGAESPTGYVNPLLERKVYFSDITDHYLPENFADPKVNTGNMGLYPTEGYWTSESSEVEFDPRYAGHMYLGKENKIYKSTNEGAIFEALDNWGVNSVVYEIEVCRQNPERLYTVIRTNGSARMHYSVDGGDSWTMSPVDPGNSGKMEISVDPANDDVVWGIEVNSSTVFKTTDGGASWEDMYTPTLSGHQLREVIVQGGSEVVYIGTNTSVFYWDADASDWVDIGAGLPARMDVLEMRIFYKESKLRLCDKGKGIWEANLVESSMPIAQPMVLNDEVYCSRDTVQFDCYSILDHNGASWAWSFDPQPNHVSSTSVRNPKVVLGTDGEFTATLTVMDGNGNSSSNEITVEVNSNCNVD